MTKPKLIVFEGPDGGGKGTQIDILKNYLKSQGKKVYCHKFPTYTDGTIGALIGQFLRGEKHLEKDNLNSASARQLMYAADRYNMKDRLSETQYDYVLLDRYSLSALVYGYSDGLRIDWLLKIDEGVLAPDMVFIILVPPQVALSRKSRQYEKPEYYETLEKLEKATTLYKEFASVYKLVFKTKTCFIDGTQPIELASKNILKVLEDERILV